ncbi:hypothetical protein P3T35_007485 [Kitasatospora sp. GP30]|uniref:hypothetical protein n=1 Tax=Kitasatospora sp. GP30 TaxID=3035084 RepID=UPI000CB17134|nr:hypothetical protein [Kitasatospora sp. GP30]MDH6145430.1 hypothetical protein [Kitasatospora sp. GP30]
MLRRAASLPGRILPVALTIALGSLGGVALATRRGTRAVVSTGLLLLGSSFVWIATSPAFMAYPQIVGQMVLLGLGLTTAPATESILSVLPPAKAGVGSAVNDATREAGGTLGVAVLGSVFTSLYAARLTDTSFAGLPQQAVSAGKQSVAAALGSAATLAPAGESRLLSDVQNSFMYGFHLACVVAAAVCLLGAIGARLALPGRAAIGPAPHHPADVDQADKAGRPDPGAVRHPLLQRRRPGPPHRPRRRHRHWAVPAAGGVHEDALPTPRLAAEPRRRRHRRRAHHHRHPAPARQDGGHTWYAISGHHSGLPGDNGTGYYYDGQNTSGGPNYMARVTIDATNGLGNWTNIVHTAAV